MSSIGNVVGLLKKERDRLARQLQGISAALEAFGAAYGRQNGSRGKISADGKARIAEAQRQRWAKLKKTGTQTKKTAGAQKRKTMSAAVRNKIAAAQRARWAKVKRAA